MATNILISFLSLLGVKHTTSFSEQHFAEHQHKYNCLDCHLCYLITKQIMLE